MLCLFIMDKNMITKLINELYPEINIIYIEELERQLLNNEMMWKPDTPSYFIQIHDENGLYSYYEHNISSVVSDFTGCEINIYQ